MKQIGISALEIANCPPHYWKIGDDGIGICCKCQEIKDFANHKDTRSELYREKSVKGGRIVQAKRRDKQALTGVIKNEIDKYYKERNGK